MGIRVKLAFDLAAKHRLDAWKAWAQCFGGVLVIRRGDSRAGSRLLRAAFEGLPEPALHHHMSLLLAELAEGLGGAGQIAEGLAVIDKALKGAVTATTLLAFPPILRQAAEPADWLRASARRRDRRGAAAHRVARRVPPRG